MKIITKFPLFIGRKWCLIYKENKRGIIYAVYGRRFEKSNRGN